MLPSCSAKKGTSISSTFSSPTCKSSFLSNIKKNLISKACCILSVDAPADPDHSTPTFNSSASKPSKAQRLLFNFKFLALIFPSRKRRLDSAIVGPRVGTKVMTSISEKHVVSQGFAELQQTYCPSRVPSTSPADCSQFPRTWRRKGDCLEKTQRKRQRAEEKSKKSSNYICVPCIGMHGAFSILFQHRCAKAGVCDLILLAAKEIGGNSIKNYWAVCKKNRNQQYKGTNTMESQSFNL